MSDVFLTADEAEFVPTLSEGLLLLGKVDVLVAAGADSGHLDMRPMIWKENPNSYILSFNGGSGMQKYESRQKCT